MDQFKLQYAELLSIAFHLAYPITENNDIFSVDQIFSKLTKPKDPTNGRYCLPCFAYVKILGNSAEVIAQKINEKFEAAMELYGSMYCYSNIDGTIYYDFEDNINKPLFKEIL